MTSTVKVANGELRMAHRTAALRLAEQQRANLKKLDSAVAAAGVGPPQKKKWICALYKKVASTHVPCE